ncbi:MAG: S8 family serine peptidase, partial [Saprospiraceae bacterium]|nr:S8 family serine peptidase [Saprospiraceae bacterium]
MYLILLYLLRWLMLPAETSVPEASYILGVEPARMATFSDLLSQQSTAASIDLIYADLDLYRLSATGGSMESFLTACEKKGIIRSWRADQQVSLRRDPNDQLWSEQWDMERIGMPQAWDISTGGLTTRGDTIVIAILDDGYDLTHEDLTGQIWHNHGEVPNDGVDNDQNGYIDDHAGLYLQSGNDDHPVAQHGTAVAGIIGASGNNGIGITGINWNIRILAISGIDQESDIIEG